MASAVKPVCCKKCGKKPEVDIVMTDLDVRKTQLSCDCREVRAYSLMSATIKWNKQN